MRSIHRRLNVPQVKRNAHVFASMVQAWMMPEEIVDQRAENKTSPCIGVSLEELGKVGVLYFQLDGTESAEYEQIRTERGYNYTDRITVNAQSLPNYEEKVKNFFQEHHDDEEVRYILEGSGYFDVRNKQDKWIRIKIEKGDLLVLPAGIYHRFSIDENDFIKVIRLFKGEPVWTPFNRGLTTDAMQARKEYIQQLA